ncbi:hypothetical protein [Niallia sp. MER 6]|uniref:hypothetical protein n=1 Tax=Niallia sp. MER 6 TaxID=2939567 RepID=UPI0020403502|nr:hypothetical protein [Niallia sp. MER 6]MCM3032835.1 hypothetical protein [Niallia sp. MER 6]
MSMKKKVQILESSLQDHKQLLKEFKQVTNHDQLRTFAAEGLKKMKPVSQKIRKLNKTVTDRELRAECLKAEAEVLKLLTMFEQIVGESNG